MNKVWCSPKEINESQVPVIYIIIYNNNNILLKIVWRHNPKLLDIHTCTHTHTENVTHIQEKKNSNYQTIVIMK